MGNGVTDIFFFVLVYEVLMYLLVNKAFVKALKEFKHGNKFFIHFTLYIVFFLYYSFFKFWFNISLKNIYLYFVLFKSNTTNLSTKEIVKHLKISKQFTYFYLCFMYK